MWSCRHTIGYEAGPDLLSYIGDYSSLNWIGQTAECFEDERAVRSPNYKLQLAESV